MRSPLELLLLTVTDVLFPMSEEERLAGRVGPREYRRDRYETSKEPTHDVVPIEGELFGHLPGSPYLLIFQILRDIDSFVKKFSQHRCLAHAHISPNLLQASDDPNPCCIMPRNRA